MVSLPGFPDETAIFNLPAAESSSAQTTWSALHSSAARQLTFALQLQARWQQHQPRRPEQVCPLTHVILSTLMRTTVTQCIHAAHSVCGGHACFSRRYLSTVLASQRELELYQHLLHHEKMLQDIKGVANSILHVHVSLFHPVCVILPGERGTCASAALVRIS